MPKPMFKLILCIDTKDNPHLKNLYQVVAEAINQPIENRDNPIFPLSNNGLMKLFEERRLPFSEMDDDMKLSQSKFSHYYTENMEEIVIQDTGSKIAVFLEEKE